MFLTATRSTCIYNKHYSRLFPRLFKSRTNTHPTAFELVPLHQQTDVRKTFRLVPSTDTAAADDDNAQLVETTQAAVPDAAPATKTFIRMSPLRSRLGWEAIFAVTMFVLCE
jgi:hypothetical protein